jgi:drug/metabolite transporter (DMT)-like permease
MTRRGWALFVAMAVIWGIPYLLIKVAVGDLSPITLVLLRTGIGALLLVPLAATRGSLAPLVRHWRAVLAYTLVEVTVPWLLLSNAERHLSSSLTGLLIATVPLIAAVLGLLGGGDDRLDTRRVVGLVVGFVGVAALLGLDVSVIDPGAVAQVGLVAVGYAIGPIVVARRLSGVPALGVVAASLALTAVVYAPLGVVQLPRTVPPGRVLAAVAVLGVVCTALAFLLFFALIAEVGPLRAQAITYVNPAVALALGVALLGEPFTLGAVVGFGLILLGLALATRRPGACGRVRPFRVLSLATKPPLAPSRSGHRDTPAGDAAA